MTKEEQNICIRLGNVRCLPATFDKRFTRNMAGIAKSNPEKDLTESQKEIMYRLLYKYRKQLPKTYNLFKNHPHCSKKI